MGVNDWALAGIFLQTDKTKGVPMMFCRKNSGRGIVSIRLGQIGFQTISFSFGQCMATFDTEHL